MATGRFPYQTLAKYPHLKPEDVATWELFIRKYPDVYDRVDYDFALGDVTEHADVAAKADIAGVERLNQYKVDVIGYGKNIIDVIELKGKATISAMGQVLAYLNLYTREIKPGIRTRAVIIAQEATPELDRLCAEHGVTLILI